MKDKMSYIKLNTDSGPNKFQADTDNKISEEFVCNSLHHHHHHFRIQLF